MSRVSELEILREQVRGLMDENVRLKHENAKLSNAIEEAHKHLRKIVERDTYEI